MTASRTSAEATLGGFFDRLLRAEAKLARWFAALRDGTPDHRVALLTYCLSRHQRIIRGELAALRPPDFRRIRLLSVTLRPDLAVERTFPLVSTPHRTVNGADLLQTAIAYQTGLSAAFRALGRGLKDKRASALLNRLAILEDREIVKLKRMMGTGFF